MNYRKRAKEAWQNFRQKTFPSSQEDMRWREVIQHYFTTILSQSQSSDLKLKHISDQISDLTGLVEKAVVIDRNATVATPNIDIDSAGGSIEYCYKDFSIQLPADHKLPVYQRDHVRYDRFLPHLAKYLPETATVVDVGANCGDTLAGMVQFNDSCEYICIEADDGFFEILLGNIRRIKERRRTLNVHPLKCLVGRDLSGVALEGSGGTKHAVASKAGGQDSVPLDRVLETFGLKTISVLKTDVDGFDYDVIQSALSTISRDHPIIFFECQYSNFSQRSGFDEILRKLQAIGYNNWTVFDNFGEVIVRTDEIKIIVQLIQYIWKQNINETTRTIYYYDILTCAENRKDLISTVLRSY